MSGDGDDTDVEAVAEGDIDGENDGKIDGEIDGENDGEIDGEIAGADACDGSDSSAWAEENYSHLVEYAE